jgi:hypothetical protein
MTQIRIKSEIPPKIAELKQFLLFSEETAFFSVVFWDEKIILRVGKPHFRFPTKHGLKEAFVMNVSDKAKDFAMKQLLNYLDKDPDNNIPKILDWFEKYDREGGVADQIRGIKKAIRDPNNNWSQLLRSLWTDIDDGQRRVLVRISSSRAR